MSENRFIEITFHNGKSIVWDAEKDGWDDYGMRSDTKVFIIWRKGNKVAFYNMDDVFSIVVR